jgi:hypothetical protein
VEIVATFNLVQTTEARHFGEVLFFYYLYRQQELGVFISILDSEEEDVANDSEDEEEDDLEGGLLFVEMGELEESGS